jgi:sec-independent protein translocase protein TatB
MFDVGLAELAVIALVALLVLGPERLPRAARMAGLYVRKARAAWHSIRSDIERELAAEDMKQALKDTRKELGMGEIRRSLHEAERAANASLNGSDKPKPEPDSAKASNDIAAADIGREPDHNPGPRA